MTKNNEDQGAGAPFCDQCAGPFLARESETQRWLEEQYGGHWDTCPNRVRGAYAEHRGSTVMNGVRLDPERPEPPFPGDSEPQGEPSDAQVRAALAAWLELKPLQRAESNLPAMRAALRAAGGVR